MCLLDENLSSLREAVYSSHLPPQIEYDEVLSETYLMLKSASISRTRKGLPYCGGDPKAFTFKCALNAMRLRVLPTLLGKKQLRDKPPGCRKWLARWVPCPVSLFSDIDPLLLKAV